MMLTPGNAVVFSRVKMAREQARADLTVNTDCTYVRSYRTVASVGIDVAVTR